MDRCLASGKWGRGTQSQLGKATTANKTENNSHLNLRILRKCCAKTWADKVRMRCLWGRWGSNCRKIRAYYCAYLPRNTPGPNAHSGAMYGPFDKAFMLLSLRTELQCLNTTPVVLLFLSYCAFVFMRMDRPIATTQTMPQPARSLLSNTSFLKRFLSAKCFYGTQSPVCVCLSVCVYVCLCACVCLVLCVHCIAGIIDTFNFTIMPFCCHHIRISIINRFVFKFSFGDFSVCYLPVILFDFQLQEGAKERTICAIF